MPRDTHEHDLLSTYTERGYAVAPDVLPVALCATLRNAVEAIQRRASEVPPEIAAKLFVFERDLPDGKRNGVAAAATGDALFIIGEPLSLDPVFAELLTDDAVLAPVRRLLGTNNIRFHFANVTMKHARVGSGISWHRDFPAKYLCPSGPSFLRVMACLDGMSDANGATRFRLGSHRAAADESGGAETALCPPGSLLFIHPQVLHGGEPNASNAPRRNVVMQWGRADDPVRGPEALEAMTNFAPDAIRTWAAARGR